MKLPLNNRVSSPIGCSIDTEQSATPEQGPSPARSARPFLKWVGGKRSILPELVKRVPQSLGTYHEPFIGGGALFFSVQPERAVISDLNPHLVAAFTAVRDDVEAVIRSLAIHASRHTRVYYERARERLLRERDSTKVAALFIYLNKTCYNGLYRVNRSGMFNVPIGSYAAPAIVDEPNLLAASAALQGVEIARGDFSTVTPRRRDFYYLDPPYHETYSGYDGSGFGDADHVRLAQFCREVDRVGAYFMLSNSDTAFVRHLYTGFHIEKVMASRSVSCKAHQRGRENELLIRNYD